MVVEHYHMTAVIHMMVEHYHMTVVLHTYFHIHMTHQAYKIAISETDSTVANIRVMVLHTMVVHMVDVHLLHTEAQFHMVPEW